ncbi:glycosyltransferase family 4 protein [Clostridium sp. DL-VIII]|uniref:glycosyltransferase family 4 protein n=1 Tax=Clostridium sp. DL-VIII TaxID=641107 RepID=UPI00031CE321|nr:glycosyltransferase family 4 protein [Clostridium sp. DL-VIII]
MKVAMIGHKRVPSREGGVEVVVEELSTRMVKQGIQVDIYNRSGYNVAGRKYDVKSNNCKNYRGCKIVTIPTFQNKKLNAIIYSFLATVRALLGRYDVIHFHAEGPCSMIWIPHLLGIYTVATIHGLDWQRSKWGGFATKYLKFGERMAAKYADEIIVLSRNVQQYFKDNYKRDTVYIPNGINETKIAEAQIITEKYNIQKGDYILFLARLVPEKGLDYLLEAFEKIDTDKKLVIAGGSSHTNDYVESIKKKVDKINEKSAKDKRIIMTGFVQGKELEELYSNAYLYVLPSDIEGMPISLLEAMSYGNCCLVSDIDENTEVIGIHGESFIKGDVENLYEKLCELVHDKDKVKSYKENVQDYVLNKYSWNKAVEKTEVLYSKKNKLLIDISE